MYQYRLSLWRAQRQAVRYKGSLSNNRRLEGSEPPNISPYYEVHLIRRYIRLACVRWVIWCGVKHNSRGRVDTMKPQITRKIWAYILLDHFVFPKMIHGVYIPFLSGWLARTQRLPAPEKKLSAMIRRWRCILWNYFLLISILSDKIPFLPLTHMASKINCKVS